MPCEHVLLNCGRCTRERDELRAENEALRKERDEWKHAASSRVAHMAKGWEEESRELHAIIGKDAETIAGLRKEVAQYSKDWDALMVLIAQAVGTDEDRECAEMGEMEEFDPWNALRKHITVADAALQPDGGERE